MALDKLTDASVQLTDASESLSIAIEKLTEPSQRL